MSSKSAQGKTEKYSGLSKTVKESTHVQPEEPRITPEQVKAAFESFGIPLNDRNHNDIAYWTLKGQSEGPKLIEELSKKRKEINQREDDETKAQEDQKKAEETRNNQMTESKATLPRLSDEELAAMFDEYGLPAPDPEWARTHLPNDPKKIRSILEMQRKTADDMLKTHAKNAVNSIPQAPKPGTMPMGGAPMMGRGGPNPLDAAGSMIQDDGPVNPFFIGDHSIVRITNPNNPNASTTWLVDAKKKVLRPFMSQKAFESAFEDPQEAEKAVITISAKDLGPGGALDGFTPLQAGKGVKDDGSMDEVEFSPFELQNRYGKAEDPEAENKALSMLDEVWGKLSPKKDMQQPDINNPQQQ